MHGNVSFTPLLVILCYAPFRGPCKKWSRLKHKVNPGKHEKCQRPAASWGTTRPQWHVWNRDQGSWPSPELLWSGFTSQTTLSSRRLKVWAVFSTSHLLSCFKHHYLRATLHPSNSPKSDGLWAFRPICGRGFLHGHIHLHSCTVSSLKLSLSTSPARRDNFTIRCSRSQAPQMYLDYHID